jgi:pimeloyl-ACP methyl ester carboxylesterase
MSRTLAAFDRSGRLACPSYWDLAADAWTQLTYNPPLPDPRQHPEAEPLDGRGRVVLVLPAFFTTDALTAPLRAFLISCGFRALGWELGFNWGPTPFLLAALRRRLDACCALAGAPISLVGLSLGGLLARDLAHDRPQDIAHVVTIVSPFRLPTASPLEPFFRLCAPFYSDDFQTTRLAEPLAMPSTAIFSRKDGVVSWESCHAEEPLGSCYEMGGAHTTIWRNPDVLRLIARRLRQRPSPPR